MSDRKPNVTNVHENASEKASSDRYLWDNKFTTDLLSRLRMYWRSSNLRQGECSPVTNSCSDFKNEILWKFAACIAARNCSMNNLRLIIAFELMNAIKFDSCPVAIFRSPWAAFRLLHDCNLKVILSLFCNHLLWENKVRYNARYNHYELKFTRNSLFKRSHNFLCTSFDQPISHRS